MESQAKTRRAAIRFALAGAAFVGVWGTASRANEPNPKAKVYKVGFLWGLPPIAEWVAAFDQGLAELGWHNGRNITVEHRSADGHFDRLPVLVAELIDRKVDLIVALSAPETAAARKATETIPIVFVVHGDPIRTGDIQSLSHPGGNVTGLSQKHPELSAKQLDLPKQIAPSTSRVAVLWNAANPAKLADWRELEPAARTLGVELQSFEVRGPADFDNAFGAIREHHPDALLTLGDPLTVTMREPLADFALRDRLPAMFTHRQFRGSRWAHVVWREFPGSFPAGCRLCRQDPQRGEPRRTPCSAARQIRIVPEPHHRQSTRSCCSASCASNSGSNHRIKSGFKVGLAAPAAVKSLPGIIDVHDI